MKKSYLFLVCLSVLFGLTGCGAGGGGDSKEPSKPITSISISNYSYNFLEVNGTLDINTNIYPYDASGSYSWVISDSSVLSVTKSYNKSTIKALKEGTATIYALSDNNVKSNELTFTVSPYYQFSFTGDDLGLNNGENTGSKSFTINGMTYTVKYQKINYDKSKKAFSFNENTCGYSLDGLYIDSDSYIYVSGFNATNTSSANSVRKMQFTASETLNGECFKAHTYYTNNYGGTNTVTFSSSKTAEKGIGSGSMKVNGVKIVCTDDAIGSGLTKLSFRIEA